MVVAPSVVEGGVGVPAPAVGSAGLLGGIVDGSVGPGVGTVGPGIPGVGLPGVPGMVLPGVPGTVLPGAPGVVDALGSLPGVICAKPAVALSNRPVAASGARIFI
jgi:hypothetical protein